MQVKVLKRFRDKREGCMRKEGELFECSEERFEEICSVDSGLVMVVDKSDSEESKNQKTVDSQDQGIEQESKDLEGDGAGEKKVAPVQPEKATTRKTKSKKE